MATEKRLIDANALKDKFLYLRKMWSETEIVLTINDAKTVDAVEVVRCEECVNHGNCLPENVFRIARIEKPYCCVGKKDGVRNA